ncbi:MAG TPA: VWA domain-containing protein [candidate division Zixibacteria bacterium]|nr:VWA domain-containing protein [candidate division Zixibacteria bacterium]
MRFADPYNLLILAGVVLLGLFAFTMLIRKKKLLARFGDIPLIVKIAPDISFARQATKITVLLIGMVFLVLVLARLQFGTHMELLKREGIDIMVAVDVSNSMSARDMVPNRLEKAKQELHGIIDHLHGDRIGLIAFAGEAFVQCPLTLDYSAARLLLTSMDQNSVSVQGTSLKSAIETAMKSFDQQSKKHKVLLLLTDGEDHEGGVVEEAEAARQEGIKIYTVGIGNPAGEPIPVLDRNGQQMGFRKDESGEVIMTRLDEETLREIALTTSGKYYHATAGEIELDKIFDEISKMEKKELEGTLVTHYDDRFQWPLLIALVLVIGEFFIPERKKVNREREHA